VKAARRLSVGSFKSPLYSIDNLLNTFKNYFNHMWTLVRDDILNGAGKCFMPIFSTVGLRIWYVGELKCFACSETITVIITYTAYTSI
jgi:hypothetical protein